MAKENANDKLKKWLEIDDVKVTKIQGIRFQVDSLFEQVKKNAHMLDESEYMIYAYVNFETLYWLIEQAEKLERIKVLVIECDADNRVPQPYEILDIINA